MFARAYELKGLPLVVALGPVSGCVAPLAEDASGADAATNARAETSVSPTDTGASRDAAAGAGGGAGADAAMTTTSPHDASVDYRDAKPWPEASSSDCCSPGCTGPMGGVAAAVRNGVTGWASSKRSNAAARPDGVPLRCETMPKPCARTGVDLLPRVVGRSRSASTPASSTAVRSTSSAQIRAPS